METEASTDQAAPEPQSALDRIAGKFGFPSGKAASEQAADSGTQADETASEPDLFDLNFDGETFRVPAKLKDAFLRNADYTQKTQELAEKSRSVDQIRELAQTRQLESVFSESVASEQQELAVVDAYLQQASKLDWSQMSTDQMLRHKVEVDSIKERRESLKQAISEKRAQFNDQVSNKLKELRGNARQLAAKQIPNFSEETEAAVRKFAVAEGLSEQETENALLDPRSYRLLYKAMQFDQVKAGTTKAADAATKAARVLKPGGAGENTSARNIEKLNFGKAMKAAGNNSSAKARVIEDRLSGVFGR